MWLTAVLAAGAPTLAAIVAYLLARKKIQEIHVIVNQQRDEMEKTIEQLRSELSEAGIAASRPATITERRLPPTEGA